MRVTNPKSTDAAPAGKRAVDSLRITFVGKQVESDKGAWKASCSETGPGDSWIGLRTEPKEFPGTWIAP